jgi:2-dehydro-3-deoxy-D-arabinonate dehydratase
MRIIKFTAQGDLTPQVGLLEDDSVVPLASGEHCLTELLHADDVAGHVRRLLLGSGPPLKLIAIRLLAPVDHQEVWGAGVTYERSKAAREKESDRAASFYDQVYTASRPELFFKATPNRVAGPEEAIRVRRDSVWCVPEPELALVVSPSLTLVGFTIGNDVSARDIEGENPLYLPQAKVYDACCALGPSITLVDEMPPRSSVGIHLAIERSGQTIYEGATTLARMVRGFDDLIDWLGRDNHFPNGVILLTGTGIVPPDDFSLKSLDRVVITIDGIGTLANPVTQGGSA